MHDPLFSVAQSHANTAFRTGNVLTPGIVTQTILAANEDARGKLIAAHDRIEELEREIGMLNKALEEKRENRRLDGLRTRHCLFQVSTADEHEPGVIPAPVVMDYVPEMAGFPPELGMYTPQITIINPPSHFLKKGKRYYISICPEDQKEILPEPVTRWPLTRIEAGASVGSLNPQPSTIH